MDVSQLSAGDSLPPGDIYGVSVHLPTWADTVNWAERDPEFLMRLKTGYPRFFIPRVVIQLASRLLKQAASLSIRTHQDSTDTEAHSATKGVASKGAPQALLLSSLESARNSQRFLARFENPYGLILRITFPNTINVVQDADGETDHVHPTSDIYAVTYSESLGNEAKAFWQHTGSGISSRCAVYWLEHAFQLRPELPCPQPPKDLPIKEARNAQVVLQKRIASQMSTSETEVLPGDVTLFPTGMSAISNVALSIRQFRKKDHQVGRVAVFGFVYVDTFKVLSRVHNFECTLYGHANSSDLDKLIADLDAGLRIEALYTEFPGNPLLATPDLSQLHQLSLKHDFILVVDDTVATSINTALFPSCDIICTSLTKMFSGACNVMGGSATLNPASRHHAALKQSLSTHTKEPYFPLDILTLELNSRDFATRVHRATSNSLHIVHQLQSHPTVTRVFYPTTVPSHPLYKKYLRPNDDEAGYGFLISIYFVTPAAAMAFHDALDVAKGPSLGTNFTLACAYTLLAHYREREWAAGFGVIEHLVRISVGVEEQGWLEGVVGRALEAAERAGE